MLPHPEAGPGQLLYELPALIKPLDAVRGTVLVLDWRALRAFGIHAAYEAAIPPPQRTALLSATAGSWVALELLVAHYQALDSLGLDEALMGRIGEAVGEGVHGAFLSTLVRLAGKLGVSPWRALEQSYKLWVRSWRGGAIRVSRVGERLAHVSLLETPVCASPFFRASFAGALRAGIAPFCTAPVVHEVTGSRPDKGVLYRATWGGDVAGAGDHA